MLNVVHVESRLWILMVLLLTGAPSWSSLWAAPLNVAEVDGQVISMTELEQFAAEPLQGLDRQRQQILESGLQQLIESRLLELEAARRGVDVGSLLGEEMERRTAKVTDADIDAWFEQNRQRVQQPKEAVATQIRRFLEQSRQQEARQALVKELRGQYKVKTLLEPQRSKIDLTGVASKGPESAPVTLVEFSDFQCPYCQRINPVLDQLRADYGDQVRLVFMQFPLTNIHPKAFKASEAALCAGAQDAFWPMHDAIFADPKNLSPDDLKGHAATLKLDEGAFADCLDEGDFTSEVRRQMAAGRSAGVSGTPTFLVNGRLLELQGGVPPEQQLKAMIDDELERLGE